NEAKPILLNARAGASPDPNHYFIAWWDIPAISKSNDGGHTFTKILLDSTDFNNKNLYEFTMYDSNYGFARADGGFYFTKDGWITFENKAKYFKYRPLRPLFLDSNILSFVTYLSDPLGCYFLKYYVKE